MGSISFSKDAGEQLLRMGQAKENAEAQHPDHAPADVEEHKQALERAIVDYMELQSLPTEGIGVTFDPDTGTVTLSGQAPDQAVREKMVLCCGNVQGVATVEDQLQVASGTGEESQWYEVKNGDTLSSIAGDVYGSPDRVSAILEANQPMLSDPENIYAGQLLRIPIQH